MIVVKMVINGKLAFSEIAFREALMMILIWCARNHTQRTLVLLQHWIGVL